MNLRSTLDSLRLVLRTQSPMDLYGSNQVATNIYIYIYIYMCGKSIALTCSTTFYQNLNSCTTQLYFL
jgi:hypothetical protein